MKERSQPLNRFLARRELLEKVSKVSGQTTSADIKMGKIRRQKAKKRKRARVKYRSEVKG
jgi:hypothetical protein